jgi:formamidopyrimidine-DNA glycosylase
MPELPEVETLRRQLEAALPGQVIAGVWFSPDKPHLLRHMDDETFVDAVRGRAVTRVGRRAKWLILDLEGGLKLVAHLRMTGRWFLRRSGDSDEAYMRSRISFESGIELRWCDVRKFGTWTLVHDFSEATGAVGPEPLSDEFTPQSILAAASGRRAPIKAFLLDQRRIAGLGNIYVDEALWAAGIHPLRPAGSITEEEAERLRAAIVEVLLDSLESGGSSMRDYLDTAGRAGRFQERWQVYKRTGSACARCREAIIKIKAAGRGTHLCPNCQQLTVPEAATMAAG